MMLNKDCVRDILMYIEKNNIYKQNSFGKDQLHAVSFDELCETDSINYENDIIHYALEKMEEHNLIKFNNIKNHSNINRCFTNYHVSEITDYGHEFLDNVKNDDDWEQMKTAMVAANIDDCSLNMYYEYIYDVVRKRLNG